MKDERQKNAENFDKQQIRNVVNIADPVVKNLRAAHCLGIRKHVDEKKRAERNNSGYLMQFSQKESFAEFNSHLSESLYRVID